jgi:hypothetical protein
MADSYKELQREYINALRALAPSILQWWNERCPYPSTDPVPWEARNDFHRRWPAGPVAHPRVLAVFRKYFFQVEELNERTAALEDARSKSTGDEDKEVWGKDVGPPTRSQVRPIDLLVNDLAYVAPDLFQFMQGLVFVPIGMDPDGEDS